MNVGDGVDLFFTAANSPVQPSGGKRIVSERLERHLSANFARVTPLFNKRAKLMHQSA